MRHISNIYGERQLSLFHSNLDKGSREWESFRGIREVPQDAYPVNEPRAEREEEREREPLQRAFYNFGLRRGRA